MKALQIPQPRRIQVIDVPESPAPGPGEILLRMHYVGFCGSDLNTWRGRNAMAKPAVIPGHEIGATIEAVGPDVPGQFCPGQIVTANPYTHCGHCASCREGRFNACEHNETLGVQRDGAMRGSLVVPWEKVIPAEGISLRDAALIEPMSVGFHAVARGQVSDTDTVLVIGCGMVGLGAVIRCLRRGATVIAADIEAGKLQMARDLGAAYTYDTGTPWEGLPAPSVVIEAVGSPATYQLAIERADFCGRVVCIGYPKSEVLLPPALIVKKELAVMGSRNAAPTDFEAVIRSIRRGEAPLDRFVSGIVRPEEAQDALERWDAAPGHVFRILTQWNTEN
ncbi:MAG: zinc-binding alcohol dehydrogenase family protein [Bacteroidales bacterium]|nr:zinc-binding alcohol dehydrogenase family protein [Bacteroidales bacterium]MBR1578420.1 zinc-binding alcohol dehydrogenase family protein [Bacteroidales bacterium]